MKTSIINIERGKMGIALPEEFMIELGLIPGAEVEMKIDKKKKWVIVRPLHGEDFIGHFKESMESMA